MPQRGWCSLSPVAASDPWCEVRGSQGRQEQCPVPHLPVPRPALRAWVPQTGCCLPALGTRGTLPVPATPTGLPLPRSARAARTEQRRAGALDRASSPKASSPAGRDSVSRAEPSRAEPCQASIPALSRPPPQGSLNTNRPFNLLRRLEGLAAGSLAGTRSPAVGTAQPRSQQGFHQPVCPGQPGANAAAPKDRHGTPGAPQGRAQAAAPTTI